MKQLEFSIQQHLEFCFHRPCPIDELPAELHDPELRPVLHLLRRDLELVYGSEEERYCPGSMKPPLVVLLAMLCGFDMLSAMLSGEDPISDDYKKAQKLLDKNGFKIKLYEVGKKYRRFMQEIAGLTKQEAAFLFVLRNSLAHMYSLNISDKAYRDNSVTTDPPNGKLIDVHANGSTKRYVLNLWKLKDKFLKAVAQLRTHIESSPEGSEARKIFQDHAKNSGYITIEGSDKRPARVGA